MEEKPKYIFKAIVNNDMDLFDTILSSPKFNIDITDRFRETPLIVACENGNEAMVKKLLFKKASLEIESKTGKTALMASIGQYELRRGPQTCFPNIITLLLNAGANHKHISSYGNPLKLALMKPEALQRFVFKVDVSIGTLIASGYDQDDIAKVNNCMQQNIAKIDSLI